MSEVAPILVIAWGNLSRGDDALAPLLAQRLEERLAAIGETRIEVLCDFQLNIEHVLDLVGRRRVLLIDADLGSEHLSCGTVLAHSDPGFSTHSVSPGSLLEIYRRLRWTDPPPIELLSIPARSFGLGEGLSATATSSLEEAWDWLIGWCRRALAGEGGDA